MGLDLILAAILELFLSFAICLRRLIPFLNEYVRCVTGFRASLAFEAFLCIRVGFRSFFPLLVAHISKESIAALVRANWQTLLFLQVCHFPFAWVFFTLI